MISYVLDRGALAVGSHDSGAPDRQEGWVESWQTLEKGICRLVIGACNLGQVALVLIDLKFRDLVEVVRHKGKSCGGAFEERESRHGGRSCLPLQKSDIGPSFSRAFPSEKWYGIPA